MNSGISIYLMIMYLSQALGSMLWGWLSAIIGVQKCMLYAAVFLFIAIFVRLLYKKLGHKIVEPQI